MTTWLARVRKLLGGKGEPPTLVRLRARSGEFIDGAVELTVRFTNGVERSWTARAAQGLCIVRFHANEQLELRLRHVKPDGVELQAVAKLTRDDVAAGFAPVLWLD